MAATRTAKVESEIEKVKAKISELQNKLRELEHKRMELENTEIVDIVRGLDVPLDDLAALLLSLKGGALTSGQNVPKLHLSDKENENE
jgi:hypothetical protein